MKHYPYECPNCDEMSGMDLYDTDYDEDTYSELWACDCCGTRWKCEFDLAKVTVDMTSEDEFP